MRGWLLLLLVLLLDLFGSCITASHKVPVSYYQLYDMGIMP